MSTAPTTENVVAGSCLCGQVSFELSGELRPVIYCHCQQCRKTSGHFVAATAVKHENLKITSDASLAWYRSSATAERGFCSNCGSSLFWRPDHGDYMSVMAGALESPTGTEGGEHIFTADAGDYYAIEDELPKYAQYDHDLRDKSNA
jgi:hypothetical protein